LETIDIEEDDGTRERQCAIDLATILSRFLASHDPEVILALTVETYVEGVATDLANQLADRADRSISYADASVQILTVDEWIRTVALLDAP
jgi:hypothetical protein